MASRNHPESIVRGDACGVKVEAAQPAMSSETESLRQPDPHRAKRYERLGSFVASESAHEL